MDFFWSFVACIVAIASCALLRRVAAGYFKTSISFPKVYAYLASILFIYAAALVSSFASTFYLLQGFDVLRNTALVVGTVVVFVVTGVNIVATAKIGGKHGSQAQ